MSLIQSTAIPSGSAAAYAIDDSCRFDNTNTTIPDSLHFTLGSPTNAKIFTLSFWAKITTNPTLTSGSNKNMVLVGSQESGGYGEAISMIRNSAGYNRANYRIEWYEEGVGNKNTAPGQFRDHSAWYHFMFITDTTSGTAADRMQLWVNGVRSTFQGEPGGGTYTYSQNATPRSFNSGVHRIGSGGVSNSQTGRGYQGYMAEMHFIDGTAQAVTDFGEFDDDSGIWKPKKVSGLTYGNNGWYLDFADSGDMGNDVSGNGNDFTLVGIDATNQSQDTPTNNFCTLNANDAQVSVASVVGKGGLSFISGSGTYSKISSTMGVGSGKWYYEIKSVVLGANATHWVFSIRDADHGSEQNATSGWGYSSGGTAAKQWGFHSSGYLFNNTDAAAQPSGSPSNTSVAAGYNTAHNEVGNIFGIAIDMDNGKYWVGRNTGSTNTGNFRWYDDGSLTANVGNPATGAYPLATNLLTGTNGGATLLLPCFALYSASGTGTAEFNFGSPPYAPTSGNADANGYGNFEFAPPSGFYALCSKNLAEFG